MTRTFTVILTALVFSATGLIPSDVLAKKASLTELIAQLKDCKGLQACDATRALIAQGPTIWPGLQEGLKASNEMTRFWSLGVLTELRIPDSRDTLITMVRDDPAIRVRGAAAFALGSLGGPEVVAPLIGALGDKDLNVRFEAVDALGRLGDPRAVTPLIKRLRDRDEDVRRASAESLGRLGDVAAVPGLVERVNEDLNPKVRAAALEALAALKDPRGLPATQAALKDTNNQVRAAGLLCYAVLTGKPALPRLQNAMTADASPRVRAYAAAALGRLKLNEGIGVLRERIGTEQDPHVLAAIVHSLGELNAISAVKEIESLLTHPNNDVKGYAAHALTQLRGQKPGTAKTSK